MITEESKPTTDCNDEVQSAEKNLKKLEITGKRINLGKNIADKIKVFSSENSGLQ